MKIIILTAPTEEPVTLDEAKDQLRIDRDEDYDDTYISSLIPVARTRCQNYCNQFFVTQNIALIGVATEEVCLPYPNLTITSVEVDEVVTTYNYDSDLQVLTLDETGDKLKVFATTGAPVEFYGVTQAIRMMIDDMYELRSESVLNVSVTENPAVKAMLYPYRLSLSI